MHCSITIPPSDLGWLLSLPPHTRYGDTLYLVALPHAIFAAYTDGANLHMQTVAREHNLFPDQSDDPRLFTIRRRVLVPTQPLTASLRPLSRQVRLRDAPIIARYLAAYYTAPILTPIETRGIQDPVRLARAIPIDDPARIERAIPSPDPEFVVGRTALGGAEHVKIVPSDPALGWMAVLLVP